MYQAFLRSYHSAPRPPTLSLVSKVSLFLSRPACVSPVELTDARVGVKGEGGGARGAKSYDREKAWPFINHSLLSAYLYSALFVQIIPIAVLAA